MAGEAETTAGDGTSGIRVSSPQVGPLAVGQPFGSRYHIIRVLGAGGMGVVYQAWDSELNVAVAVKVIRPEALGDPAGAAEIERRFKRELVLARNVTHRNVVRIHDLGERDGIKYLTMPFVEGEDLAAALRRRGTLPVPEALHIARQVAAGLAAAHEAGVIHRDLKPENIMLAADGTALIMDFGISRSISGTATATALGAVVGTLEYMAPEQAQGQPVDPRADIYAFGLMLYDMLTGRQRLTRGNPMSEIMSRMQHGPPALRQLDPAIPEAVEQIVARSVEPSPDKRYQRTSDLLAALDGLTADGHPALTARAPSRSLLAPLALGLALVALALAGWSMLGSRRPAAPAAPPKPLSILVANFDNRAGEEQFEGLLEQAMAVGIEGTSFITAFPRRDALRVAREIAPDRTLTEDVARLVSTREGIDRIVAGAISSPDGRRYRLELKVLDPADARPLMEWNTDVASKAEVLAAVGRGAAQVRSALGDRTASAADAETFTAKSIEAAQAYARAQERNWAGDTEAAIAEYEKAIALDPELGRAYSGLAALHFNAGRREQAIDYYKEAMKHTDRMTERERLRTRGGYYLMIRNSAKANEELQTLVDKYPADTAALANLAVNRVYERRMAEAVELGKRAAGIYPKNVIRRNNVALFMMYAGDFDGAEREARAALALKPDYVKALVALAMAQFGRGQIGEAEGTWKQLDGIAAGRTFAVAGLADLALYRGRIADAIAVLTRDGASPADPRRLVTLAEAQFAQGNESAAAASALAAAQSEGGKNDPVVTFLAGQILAQARRPQASAIATTLRTHIDSDPRMYGFLLDGEIALRNGDARAALDHLNQAQKLGDSWLGRYALGRAYLAAERFTEAESEFDLCLGKRLGEVTAAFLDEIPTYRLLPPVHYYMGLVREGMKNDRGAAESFRRFLEVKKDGDEQRLVADARRRLR
ncbi:MAG TPA: protein kinase [Vicinamibacterales bacterium]|nr:protein kinase [Vicinamibacterales bacterium]